MVNEFSCKYSVVKTYHYQSVYQSYGAESEYTSTSLYAQAIHNTEAYSYAKCYEPQHCRKGISLAIVGDNDIKNKIF